MSLVGNEALPSPFPTFFFTLSAADTVWPDFFRACNSALSWEEASRLPAAVRRRYLKKKADIASKHFYRRFKSFFENIICGASRPLGEIVDFFWRVEFQKRGSPHVHGLLWVKDAPDVLELSKTDHGRKELEAFVDRHISADDLRPPSSCECPICVQQDLDPNLDPLTQRPPNPCNPSSRCDLSNVVRRVQQHVCFPQSRCRTKRGLCRFDFPKQLRDRTAVSVERSENGALRLHVECHRSDPGTNNYNGQLLSAWRANMDVKLVGNAYGAAEYTAAYVSKAEPDTSKFLESITRALNKCTDDTEHCDVLRRIGNATLAAREVSAQEALWILQNGLPMYGKSRNVVKVKSSRHSQRHYRVTLAKCREEIESESPLIDDQIRIDPLEAAYMARPSCFDDLTYKEFLQRYEISKAPPSDGQSLERWARTDGKGYIKARRNPQALAKVPRWRADPESADYCFSEILFRKPWRVLEDLPETDADCIAIFAEMRQSPLHTITLNERLHREQQLILLQQSNDQSPLPLPMTEWAYGKTNHDLGVTSIQSDLPQSSCPVPSAEYTEDDIKRAESFISSVVKPYMRDQLDPKHSGNLSHQPHHQYQYPIGLPSNNMGPDQWKGFATCMDQSRRRLKCNKAGTHCEPLTMVLNGEGGCGKSWLIKHIVKDVHHVFGDHNISNRRSKRVLLMAHHGTAAFNIKGSTICSALSLPRMTRKGYEEPYEAFVDTKSGPAKLRTLQDKYRDVHLVIIDEYSVISCAMLYWIDMRMREIWPSCRDLPFGGRDVILAGDLGQLSPVMPASLCTPVAELTNTNQQNGRRLWLAMKYVCNLTSQNRGREDTEWYAALSRLRRMEETAADIALFNTRYAAPMTVSSETKFLAYKNDDVDEANRNFLSRQPNPAYELRATHNVEHIRVRDEPDGDGTVINSLLEAATVPHRTRDKQIPPRLSLALGCPVSLTTNLEQRAGLCNGTRAIVHDFMTRSDADLPIVLVEIVDKYIGPSFREDKPNIVPIVPQTITWTAKGTDLRTRRRGLPLRLAYAMTIHKVQGLTCDSVIFDPTDIPSSAFAYVGLSRVRHRDHISLHRALTQKNTGLPSKTKQHLTAEWKRLGQMDRTAEWERIPLISRYQQIAETENNNSGAL